MMAHGCREKATLNTFKIFLLPAARLFFSLGGWVDGGDFYQLWLANLIVLDHVHHTEVSLHQM